MKLTVFILCVLLISACSSNDLSHASCDFVSGAAENERQREQGLSSPGARDIQADSNKRTQDTSVGFFSILAGALSRALSSDDADTPCL
ncbi:hypothetical protein FM037_23580 [Shewanella psychropiezotolerans]|uniref:Lipoprotein n=1 Tax=Shewanella psychropiezotolerans TaxID=2593655 RepID=A0ABX5X2X3_9GAMM|nr:MULTISPECIES: hypothetical protein [Shewanella]MPY23649.1 hypothetical protein [Shewanella sp. YLB-07]QDO85699.1 hypothetical protein FM037_23580 [Shewanella psychropiezotolerans]